MGKAPLVVGGLATAALGFLALVTLLPGPAPLLVAFAVVLGLAGGLLFGWQSSRSAVRATATEPVSLEWMEALPAPDPAAQEELAGLGYAPCGGLRRAENGHLTHVYLHRELPIYVLAAHEAHAGEEAFLQFESFFQDGSRVTTTTRTWRARVATAVPSERPRLVQFRAGGTPTALDGQHVGTVRAWAGGGRKPLPATREALLGYLEADRRALRDSLERGGWLPLSTYLAWMAGGPKRILRF